MSQGSAAFDLPADPFFNVRFNPAHRPCSQGHRFWEASLTHHWYTVLRERPVRSSTFGSRKILLDILAPHQIHIVTSLYSNVHFNRRGELHSGCRS